MVEDTLKKRHHVERRKHGHPAAKNLGHHRRVTPSNREAPTQIPAAVITAMKT